MVIMRSKRSRDPDYPRNWKGDLLAGSRKPWKRNVYKEPWPMARRKAKRPPLVKKPDTYERWDDFERWST